MNIRINIERLVVNGLSIPDHEHRLLKSAVESELTRLLAAGGLASNLLRDTAVPHVSTQGVFLSPKMPSARLGQQVAQSVYGGLSTRDQARWCS